MLRSILKILGAIVAVAAIGAAYAGCIHRNHSVRLVVVRAPALVIKWGRSSCTCALHRALQHARSHAGFRLNFFLETRSLMQSRAEETGPANDGIWNLLENYFRREAELTTP
jgi:hypothetical protein